LKCENWNKYKSTIIYFLSQETDR